MLKTRLYPTNCKRTENLQAFIVNPYWVIFQKMTLLLIATVIMMILIIGPLTDLDSKINEAESSLSDMLGELTGNDYDMKAFAELIELLGGSNDVE